MTTDRPAIDLTGDQFRALGHDLIDHLAESRDGTAARPVGPDTTPAAGRRALGQGGLPRGGGDPADLLAEAAELILTDNRLTGHPRQWGYIIGSGAPIR